MPTTLHDRRTSKSRHESPESTTSKLGCSWTESSPSSRLALGCDVFQHGSKPTKCFRSKECCFSFLQQRTPTHMLWAAGNSRKKTPPARVASCWTWIRCWRKRARRYIHQILIVEHFDAQNDYISCVVYIYTVDVYIYIHVHVYTIYIYIHTYIIQEYSRYMYLLYIV